MNYFKVGNLKLAEVYLKQTEKLAVQIKDQLRYAKALGNLAQIKQQKGDHKSAISLLEKDIEISEKLKNHQNTIYASILLAKIYLADKNFDESEKILNNIHTIVHSKSYFEKLELQIIELELELLSKQNKTGDELMLRRRMIVLEDSLENKDSDMAINTANWAIQKTKYQNKIKKSEDKFKDESTLNNIYISLIIIIITVVLIFLLFYKKQQKTRQFLYSQKVTLLELDKLKIEQKLFETDQTLNDQLFYLKEKNNQIKQLKIEIDDIKNSSSHYLEKKNGKLNTLLESHLMTEENWENFKKAFQKEHPAFYFKLQKEYPEITDSNKRILLLQKLNLNNTEIAGILGITIDAVKKSKQRIKKKIGVKYEMIFENE